MKTLLILILFATAAYAQDIGSVSIAKTEKWRDKGGKQFNVSVSSRNKTWRFVHDGKNLLVKPFLSDGVTATKSVLIEAATEQAAWDEIDRLRLVVEQESEIQEKLDAIEARLVALERKE